MKRNDLVTFIVISILVLVIVNGLIIRFYGGFNGGSIDENGESGEFENETAQTYIVIIDNFGFIPEELAINKGDTIVWMNNDVKIGHTLVSIRGNKEISSGRILPGGNYSHTFNTEGEVVYISATTEIQGRIIVQ